jgi:hypothetical protein
VLAAWAVAVVHTVVGKFVNRSSCGTSSKIQGASSQRSIVALGKGVKFGGDARCALERL